ncbi:MAG: ABC transporter ATP-binding protein [Actinobacteria bacterium]|nr:ABC transporter ATP-binding protein [Actinomycetota bacterium]MCG2817455.1 ABC transporter ATP-binding protein [Actinomycetes bacterium]MBU4178503.1 ABC transporter ATP-binding protein [Actinomycetota bacterium]MBU4217938.1 ABC transporter ATP-binding protein [Actinomycetota bacterium]MBU4360029.1 ABC transporter ATP-binding protein [Actinomycetota bacterium]
MEHAVEVREVSKMFKLYHENVRSLKEKVLFFRKRGYEEFWALRDIDLDVEKGETLGIIGANGSGKSTLLKCMTRIIYPTSGKIMTDGSIAALLELGAGFQPDLTGRENVYLNASILGFSRKEVDGKFDEIVAFAELERFIDNYVRNYSSGMYIRLGFAVAISVDPEILIVDEVLAVGDEAFQRKCLDKIDEFRDSGKTIIFVTHNVDVTREICDRVIMLEEGRIVRDGIPKEVVNHYHQVMETEEEASEQGNRKIEITEVRLLNDRGEETNDFYTGSSMKVRVCYEAREPIVDPVFGFSLDDYRGFTAFGTNTALKGLEMGTVAGDGVVEFDLKSLPMLEGRYLVSVAAHSRDEQTVYHWQDKLYQFEMKSDIDDVGLLYIPCEVKTGPQAG